MIFSLSEGFGELLGDKIPHFLATKHTKWLSILIDASTKEVELDSCLSSFPAHLHAAVLNPTIKPFTLLEIYSKEKDLIKILLSANQSSDLKDELVNLYQRTCCQ